MRAARRIALVLAGVVLLAVLALIAAGVYLSGHGDRLLAAVGTNLGREVQAGSFGFTLRGGVGVRLEGVRIADDPALGRTDPFLTARALELRVRLLPLLHRALVVDRVLLDAPVVSLVRAANGHMNVETLGRPAGSPPPPAPAAERTTTTMPTPPPAGTPQSPAARQAFQVALVRLRDGAVRYREDATGRVMELSEVRVDAQQPGLDAPIPITVHARIATTGLRLDAIDGEGVLDPSPARLAFKGSVRAGPGMLGALAIERLDATAHVSPSSVDLESFTLSVLDGTVAGSARLVPAGPGAGLTARCDAQQLDLAQLPARGDRPRPAGRLELHGTFAAPPPGLPGFKAGATGDGRFAVADGRLTGVVLGGGLLDAVAPVLKPGVADRLRTRYPDLFAADELRFTRMSGSARLAAGRFRSDDLVIAGASYEARGEGTLTLDGDVDAVVRVSGSPALTDDLLGDSRARPALVGSDGRVTVPLRVRGPLQRPRVTPDSSFVSTAARGLLGGNNLEGLGDVVNRLLGGRKKR